MLGPNVVLFTVFVGVPIVLAFALSFFAWDLNGAPTWVGLANYTAMFKDPLVGISVKNTLYFVAMGVIPTVFISLGLAMLINFQFRGVTIVRSLYLIPAAVSLAAAGRTTSRPGMFRSDHRCSIGWCVGPSSPRPIESCVQT